jgi:endonuclease I
MVHRLIDTSSKNWITSIKKILILLLVSHLSFGQIPNGYYDRAANLTGETLKKSLYNIIKGHTTYPYTSTGLDTWDILKIADQDPKNRDNVIGIYSGFSMNGEAEYNNGNGWSREHVWSKSRGNFGTSRGIGTDCHHLRAEDVSTNNARSNRNFDECSTVYIDKSGTYKGSTESFTSGTSFVWKPREEVLGDIARILFYMATRYEGENGEPDLELTEILQSRTSNEPLHARLSTLLTWHLEDPVSQAEKDRNNVIYDFQRNRNPYIDHPEYVECIWGNACQSTLLANIIVSDLQQNYDGTEKQVTVTTIPTGLAYKITYDSSSTLPSNAGEYIVKIDINELNYTGASSSILKINPIEANIIVSDLQQNYDGTEKQVKVTTIPTGLAYKITYDSSSTLPSNTGEYIVKIDINELNYTGAYSSILKINPIEANIIVSDLQQNYDGT